MIVLTIGSRAYDLYAARQALVLVEQIADMTKDGEGADPDDPDDEGYVIENDDAWETVMSLISEARQILGQPVDREEARDVPPDV